MTTSPLANPPTNPAERSSAAFDLVLTLLALLLAFALASTAVHESDIWRHLATGRSISQGDGGIHSDPFTYTQPDTPWINRGWLGDVVLFQLHAVLGDNVVLLKALLAAWIAGLMIAAGGSRRSVAVGATVLGLVAAGPYLTLRPELVSGLLLAFTAYWLQRPSAETPFKQLRADLPLFFAIVLWANVGDESLLGPLLVGLHAAFDRRRWPTFALGLACCLLNPHHIRGLALPSVEFAATWPRLTRDSWTDLALVPHFAFGVLVLLSAASFVVNRTKVDGASGVAWLGLLAASFWCEPAKLFFTIIAAPLLARNLVDWRFEPRTGRRRVVLRTAGVLLLLGLVAASLPGWVQGRREARAWRLVADPSLQRMAENLAKPENRLASTDRVLPLSREAAHHLEWFAPGTKVFLDGRRGFFTDETARDFRELREAFAAQPALLDRWRITHLLVHDPSDRYAFAALQRVWGPPWKAVALEGRAVLFVRGVNGPIRELDLAALAFRPETARTAPDTTGEPREPRSAWLSLLLPAQPPDPFDEGEALACVAHFESQRPASLAKHKANWEALQIGAMVATVAPGRGLVGSLAELPLHAALLTGSQRGTSSAAVSQLAGRLIADHLRRGDDGPAGSLFLALRAARRALHENPDDALAWLRLGQAYYRLDRHTRERVADLPLLRRLRKLQLMASLQQAVRLDPDLAPAHETLVKLCLEDNRFDLALRHLRQQIRLVEAFGPRAPETAEQFDARLQSLRADEAALGQQVRERLNRTEAQAFPLGAFAKARLAQEQGLAQRALQVLLRSAYGEFGREGALMELYLLLANGQIDDVKMWIEPAQEPVLGTAEFCWLTTLLGAVAGDYARADAALMRMRSTLQAVDVPEAGLRGVPPEQAIALIVAKRLLDEANLQPLVWRENEAIAGPRLKSIGAALNSRAELSTLRGLLALEHGVHSAADHFREALREGASENSLARHYLQLLQRHTAR